MFSHEKKVLRSQPILEEIEHVARSALKRGWSFYYSAFAFSPIADI